MPLRLQPVKPGEWVRVRVTGDPFPVTMSIGDSPAQAAFVDHERGAESVVTFIQRRCPQLSPGVYNVIVRTPDQTIRGSIRVR